MAIGVSIIYCLAHVQGIQAVLTLYKKTKINFSESQKNDLYPLALHPNRQLKTLSISI